MVSRYCLNVVWLVVLQLALFSAVVQAEEVVAPADATLMPLVLSGVDGALADNVRAWLPALPQCQAEPLQQQLWLRQAQKSSVKAMQALGYFSAQVQAHIGEPTQPGCALILLDMDAGQPVRYRHLLLQLQGEGEQDKVLQSVMTAHGFVVGEPLNQGRYEAFKSSLKSSLQARGYLDAQFEQQQLLVDPTALTVDVTLMVQTGKRYHFGDFQLHQTFLDDAFVRRYVQLKSGEPFDVDALTGVSQRLAASGYFDDVRLRQVHDDAFPNEIPVDIFLTPAKRTRYAFSVGYGSDTGERLGAEVKRRWVNRAGHQWWASAQYSLKKQSLESHYILPLDNPLKDKLDWSLLAQYEQNDNWGEGSSFRFGPQYVHALDDGWTGIAFVEAMDAQTTFSGDPLREGRFVMLGVRLSKRLADDVVLPTKGWRLSAEVKGAEKSLLSSTSLVQGKASLKGLMPLGEGSLSARIESGATWVEDFDQLPKPLRFFTGGDGTVRGFSFESLGPKNASGKNIGGQYLLVGSVEYDHPIKDAWHGAVFYDTGNAFNDWKVGVNEMMQSVGFGVRWQTPVGFVKADLAWPIVPDNMAGPRLHLGIGVPL